LKGLQWQGEVLILHVHVQPNASKNEWAGLYGERLKLRIKSPPVDGKANAHLLKFIAAEFGVTKTACQLLSGESSRDKKISIQSPHLIPSFMTTIEN
jgi:uncharacterized protein (TIGR00251 family)